MTQIILPRNETNAGNPLYDLANELSRSSDDGKGISRVQNGHLIFEGHFMHYLTHDKIMIIANNGGEIQNNLMYGRLPVSVLDQEIPEGLPNRTMKIPGGSTIVKKFNQWADSHIKLMYDNKYEFFYVSSDPIQQKPLLATQLKVMVDTFGAQLLSMPEYEAIKSTLV